MKNWPKTVKEKAIEDSYGCGLLLELKADGEVFLTAAGSSPGEVVVLELSREQVRDLIQGLEEFSNEAG